MATAPAQPASAQGLFEALFGGFHRRAPAPPQVSSFADPFGTFSHEPRRHSDGGGGPSVSYCVRTCDGRFFPIQRNASASPAETCKSFCPAARTKIFSGSKIDYATASDGSRYSDLDNAFVYRERVVEGCTCNGKDAFGLARVDVAEDPTLRAGDIVATNEGLTVARGSRGKTAEFTPINPNSSEWAKRLAGTKVTPQPPVEKVQPIAEEPEKRRSRSRAVQLNR